MSPLFYLCFYKPKIIIIIVIIIIIIIVRTELGLDPI